MRSIFGDKSNGYFRINGKLKNASDDLDDASPRNIAFLRDEARFIIEDNTEAIDTIVGLL